jgi:hypothetical protein
MAAETELRAQRNGILGEWYLRHMTVTELAADAFGDVDRIIEIDVIGQIIPPTRRCTIREVFAEPALVRIY